MQQTSVAAALRLGNLGVTPPVVLAPMAGVTNVAFRQLCREQVVAGSPGTAEQTGNAEQTGTTEFTGPVGPVGPNGHRGKAGAQAAGLFVCEMITSRGLVEQDATTRRMLAFDPGDTVRSVQLYGVDPFYIGEATRILCGDYGVSHVDLNFGCPVPKVTRRGGGAALPWKRGLLGQILRAAVAAAEPYGVPVTTKTRKGIDDDHLTYLDAGRIAEESGAAAIALHGRTAAQHYSGDADWKAIAELVRHVSIPVLGNGDIWEASDGLAMRAGTGCAGIVVGRGCLGRPWLFADLAAAFAGRSDRRLPDLGEVASMMRRHVELLATDMGEFRGCRDFRKHVPWYLKGFGVRRQLRADLGLVSSLAELDDLLAQLDGRQEFPVEELGRPRGRQGSPRNVTLPERWLDDRDGRGSLDLSAAELNISGG